MSQLTDALGAIETHKHIDTVRAKLYLFIKELMERAHLHDQSKLASPELEIFGKYTPKLGKVEYGSAEYKALLEKVKPAIEHHYAKNRHHTEHHKNGIEDMTLVDLVELIADWSAATERNKNGNIRKSIEINAAKYNISPQLVKILENTVQEYL